MYGQDGVIEIVILHSLLTRSLVKGTHFHHTITLPGVGFMWNVNEHFDFGMCGYMCVASFFN